MMLALFCNAQNSNFDTNADDKIGIIDVCNTINETIKKQNTEEANLLLIKLNNTVDVVLGIVPRTPVYEDIVVNGQTYHLGISGAIDLGLESGTKWAAYNVGANSPDEYGDYYAWGETEPYYIEGNSQVTPCSTWRTGKTGYNWSSYFDSISNSDSNFKKYAVDKKHVLEPEDDVAHVKWRGDWRIPTKEEFSELRELTMRWLQYKGHRGCIAFGTNGNAIFLPAADFRQNATLIGQKGSLHYWVNSLDNTNSNIANCEAIGLTSWSDLPDNLRCNGLSIRPVCGGSESHDGGEEAN